MILFTATWCKPCKQLKDWLKSKDFPIDLVDVDTNREVVKQLGIKGIPALVDGDNLVVTNEKIRPYLETTHGAK